MSLENTEQENIGSDHRDYMFNWTLTVEDYDSILSTWDGDMPNKYDWWYEFSPFAKHVLKNTMVYLPDKGKPININEENYSLYLPIMKRYFLTNEEYNTIVRNVGWMKNDALQLFRETPVLKVYNMMKMWSSVPTVNEFLTMNYKVFMKLYLYSIGDGFIMPKAEEEADYHG